MAAVGHGLMHPAPTVPIFVGGEVQGGSGAHEFAPSPPRGAQIQERLQQSIESHRLIDVHHMRALRHDDQGGPRQGCPGEVGRLGGNDIAIADHDQGRRLDARERTREIEAFQIPVDAKVGAAYPHFSQHFHAGRRRMLEARRRSLGVHIRSERPCGGRRITLGVSTVRLEYASLFMAREARPQAAPAGVCSDAPKVSIHAACARTRAGENKTQDPFRMSHGIGLRQNAAEGVTKHHQLRTVRSALRTRSMSFTIHRACSLWDPRAAPSGPIRAHRSAPIDNASPRVSAREESRCDRRRDRRAATTGARHGRASCSRFARPRPR